MKTILLCLSVVFLLQAYAHSSDVSIREEEAFVAACFNDFYPQPMSIDDNKNFTNGSVNKGVSGESLFQAPVQKNAGKSLYVTARFKEGCFEKTYVIEMFLEFQTKQSYTVECPVRVDDTSDDSLFNLLEHEKPSRDQTYKLKAMYFKRKSKRQICYSMLNKIGIPGNERNTYIKGNSLPELYFSVKIKHPSDGKIICQSRMLLPFRKRDQISQKTMNTNELRNFEKLLFNVNVAFGKKRASLSFTQPSNIKIQITEIHDSISDVRFHLADHF